MSNRFKKNDEYVNNKLSGSLFYRIVKRFLDLTISILLLVPVVIIILISAIIIKIEDGGSVFYLADRIGKFGIPFKMYKIRTMKEDALDIRYLDGTTYNCDDDSRVTKFGKFARKTSIDELPQIINIIKGDMSLVGPRPDTLMYLGKYTEEEKIVLTVRPGITGYNQVTKRNSVLTKEKLKNDIFYVQHLSILFDIWILIMTVVAVLKKDNINHKLSEEMETFIVKEDSRKE